MTKQTETVRPPHIKVNWAAPIITFTVGAVLAGSENRGVKALGAGLAVAAALNLLNKLAAMVD